MAFNRFQRRCPSVTRIRAQMLGASHRRGRASYLYRVQYRFELGHIMPVRPGHDER
jgi:hypothetical protein